MGWKIVSILKGYALSYCLVCFNNGSEGTLDSNIERVRQDLARLNLDALEAQNRSSGTTLGFAVITVLAAAAVAAIAAHLFEGVLPCGSMLFKPSALV
jgi:hypothetical protein